MFRTEDLIKAERFGSFVVPTQYQDEVVGFVQQLAEAKHEKCIDLRIMRARYRLDQMLRAAKRSDPLFVIVPAYAVTKDVYNTLLYHYVFSGPLVMIYIGENGLLH